MQILDFLTVDAIKLNLESKTKKDAIKELVELLVKSSSRVPRNLSRATPSLPILAGESTSLRHQEICIGSVARFSRSRFTLAPLA